MYKKDIDISKLVENAMKQHKEYIASSTNPKWHRTEGESHMKSTFHSSHASVINEYENKIYDQRCYDKTLSTEQRIKYLEKSIQAYNDLKDYCYQSPEGALYFQDMWEHCHNSHNPDFAFVDNLKVSLDKLMIKQQKESDFENLENDLYETLTIEHPILQSKLLSYYPSQYRNRIKKILVEWESYEAISKVKQGKSYLIDLID